MDAANFLLLSALLVMHFATIAGGFRVVATKNNTRDLDALLALKATILDPQNIIPTNWSSSTSLCNWIGITCNARHQRVAAIVLPHMGLLGTIPPELGNLSFLVRLNFVNNSLHGHLPTELSHLRRLKYIDLESNAFDGGFPSWLATLPELRVLNFLYNNFSGSLMSCGISNVTKLETLNLGHNSFTGNIPDEFSGLKNLSIVNIGHNQLTGSLPPSLFNLSSLEILSLTNNSLSGSLPEHICNHLPQLQGLFLSINQVEGEIPSGIGKCSRIQHFSFATNKFTGSIPREFWNLSMLQTVYREENYLKGQIPEDIYNLQDFTVLDIRNNEMTGTIPQAIGYLNKLEYLALDSNRFTGPIPAKLFNISSLQAISLVANGLSGGLPTTLGIMLPSLEYLYVGGNRLSGVLELTSISNASSLIGLDVSFNQFTGAIPHSLGDLRLLEVLDLKSNSFSYKSNSGEISLLISLSNCRYLQELELDESPLNGFLPTSIGNLSNNLRLLSLNYCGIFGQIPSSIENLTNLADLSLGGNALEGINPASIRRLSELQKVELSYNRIQGPFPSELCDLVNLGRLSLSSNMVSGRLPSCIGNITSLRYLYLDSNNLTSKLPSNLWSLSDILELNLSTNTFQGSFPPEIQSLKALTIMDLSVNHFYGDIPSTIGALQMLEELSLKHNRLQGPIPDSMKNMLELQYLDLSFNNLTGAIPKSLELLQNLVHFNVSFNKLRGPVPHGGPFANFTELSFLSNEALCDAPWVQPCQTFEHRSRKKTLLFVLSAVGSTMFAMVMSILVIRKWRRKIVIPTNFVAEATIERVSFHELRQVTNGFHEDMLLGSGAFGSVYKGVRENGMTWAIKTFDLQLEGAFKSFDTECEVLRSVRHRNLTKVISACSSPDFKALVLEYMPNGSLEKWLYSGSQILNIKQRLDIMIDVACGLEYLHYGYSTPVVHCDLKPSNILLNQDMVGHVCDFGITKLLGDGENVKQTKTLATFGYIAPEYGLEGLVSTSCDVYSFGITLMETFTKRRPKDEMFTEELSLRRWIEESVPDFGIKVMDADLLHLEDELVKSKLACISSILQLGLYCTTYSPEERMNMKDVLRALQKIKLQFFEELKPLKQTPKV
nr:receptor kinase-like protein Xa21 [Coffea arabica]